ncbi:MAG: adenylate cyclase, partial [Mesorhizobium sp.]
ATVPRVGYRFTGVIEQLGETKRKPLPLPGKPSIAVLPFVNFGNDPEQESFADGLTEDLITDLSRNAGLFVIARNSVFV